MRPLLIYGGTLVTPERVFPGDLLVEDGRIAAVGPDLPRPPDAQTISAAGLLVLPGLIDPHVHLREPGDTHKEDIGSGTAAALAGGFTTVLAMPNTRPPLTNRETLQEGIRRATAKAVCDVGFFLGATPNNASEAAALVEPIGLKVYMGASTGDLLVDTLPALLAHFQSYPPDRIIAVHAEDAGAIDWFSRQGRGRPPLCALLALTRALTLAGRFRRRLHVCHVSTGAELAIIRVARGLGVRVTCEATPHHLFLTTRDLDRLGPLGRVNPPLRSPEEAAGLWAGLADMDCIATDHAPHTWEEKQGASPPAGMPGLETALPLLLTAVSQNRLPLYEVARLMAEGPAQIFNLPTKGRLAPGGDADLVLVDPNTQWEIKNERLHTRCGWSPFAGWEVKGHVEKVFLRGELAYEDGAILLPPGSGRILNPPAPERS